MLNVAADTGIFLLLPARLDCFCVSCSVFEISAVELPPFLEFN